MHKKKSIIVANILNFKTHVKYFRIRLLKEHSPNPPLMGFT